jgi:hypothetical protein
LGFHAPKRPGCTVTVKGLAQDRPSS